jgi:hypothetical protein
VAPPLDLSDEEEIDVNTVDDEDTEDDVFEAASDAEVDNEESDNDVVDAEFDEEDEWFVTAFSAIKDNETAADSDAKNEHDIVSPSRKLDNGIVIFEEPVVDDNGMTRIGAQPQDEKPFVLTGPVEYLKRELSATVSRRFLSTDAKLPGADLKELIVRKAKLVSHLESLLVPHGEGRAKIVCDYTGMEMSWGAGSQGRSLEAHYHFTVNNGRLHYHALPNVGLVFSTLNWLKGDSSILIIPLIALLLRTQQQRNFQVKKGIMSWAYIALQNVNVLETIHHCRGTHEARLGKLGKLDKAEWKAILEDLRTGRLRPEVEKALRSWTRAQLLCGAHRERGWLRADISVPSHISWKAVYGWLQSVAGRYGLTPDEFQFYCTVPSPSRPGRRVFYPYSVLSRPEAEELSWDWCTLYQTAKDMLWRMRNFCNKPAEKRGLGEKKMDELLFIVWWCHHLCRKIQAAKQEQPEATPEEIRLDIVDRWGLPIVPWTGNPLCASLCKLQDHGIPMVFGLAWPDGEEFDPVEHFDFNACTVTIDTKATNMAMRNFQQHTWPSILEVVKASPLSHSLWEIDPALGFKSWIPEATWHTAMPPPEAPLPPFKVPLLPIDAWFDSNASLPPLQCVECDDSRVFQTMGLLVQHCRTVHGGEGGNSRLTLHNSLDPQQDKVDDALWEDRVHRCTWDGCGATFARKSLLEIHINSVHLKIRHKCPKCGVTASTKQNLLRHMKKHADPDADTRPWPCRVEGCPRRFDSRRDVNDHLGVDHGWTVYRCDVEGCDAVFTTADSLGKHKELHKAPLKCRKGCSKVFRSAGSRSIHERTVHGGMRFTCAVEGCGKAYVDKRSLVKHMAKKHPDVET